MMVSQSFSKNFGLYNERAGNLVFLVNDASTIESVKSQASLIIRAGYSNPVCEQFLKYDLPTPADLDNNLTILTKDYRVLKYHILTTFVLSYTSTHSRRTGPASSTPC